MSEADSNAGLVAGSRFPTTRWSLIVATRQRPTTQARDALAHLCGNYWFPLYAFVRRRCARIEDAQDLTQGFFACLLEKEYLKDFDRERGRSARSYWRPFVTLSRMSATASERKSVGEVRFRYRSICKKQSGGTFWIRVMT
jgi:hypothetical protein